MLLQKEKMVALLAVISLVLITSIAAVAFWFVAETCPSRPLCVSCPYDWISYNRKCYYFSDTVGTWHFSERFCGSHGASLSAVDTQWEMNFIMRSKASGDHWIGLQRKKVGQPWKWINGSVFNNWFEVGANGRCAFLNDYTASSTECEGEIRWICAKSLS